MQHTTRARALVASSAVALLFAACSGDGGGADPSGGASADPGDTSEVVDIAVNPWVGYEANAGVVGYLLENELGFEVEYKDLAEQVSWEGFESGDVDAIVENWGHADLIQTYVEEKGVAVAAGSTGIDGIIGWFVPPWMAEEYPDITDWENLNGYAELFKTSESGDKGQFLAGDPSFVTADAAIIAGLDLDYEVVYAGSEAALIEQFRSAEQNRTPLLGYFYSPQWFLNEVPLVKIDLPPWTEGCDYDAEGNLLPEVTCDYAPYSPLDKYISKNLEDNAPRAAEFIKNFEWTAEHQNAVADLITNEGMDREEAAQQWVEENESVWQAWIPAE
jgi:glycine betaine/proline transport system substrate-binding protein